MKKLKSTFSATLFLALTSMVLLAGCTVGQEPFAGACNDISNDAEKILAKLSVIENSKSLTFMEQREDIWADGYKNMSEYFESFDSDTAMIKILVGADDEFRARFDEEELLILDGLLEEIDSLSRSSHDGRMEEAYDKIAGNVQAIREACHLM